MPLYCVTLDLKREGQLYSGLWAELDTPSSKRLLKSTWLMNTPESGQTLSDRLASKIDGDDSLLVTPFSSMHWGQLPLDAQIWIVVQRDFPSIEAPPIMSSPVDHFFADLRQG